MINLKEKVPVKLKICPQCMSRNVKFFYEIESLPKSEHTKNWLDVRYYVPMVTCSDCETTSATVEWLQAQHDAVLVAMGGMTIKQMKDLRKRLGFKSATSFARYLGIGDTTVKRWESRACFPDSAGRMLLKLADAGVDLSIVKNEDREDR